MFTDTHCHIHESSYDDSEGALRRAIDSGVSRIVCIGTDNNSSIEALEFSKKHEGVWASVGAHPHDAKDGYSEVEKLAKSGERKIVAIGEIGLDYFYNYSPREVQIEAFEAQLQLAYDNNLPVVFHVREAFDDFWPIFRNFPGTRGVLHSFTDSLENMEKAVSEGLFIGINGISTFSKDDSQRQVWDSVPLESMLLETDAPFLTPVPHRGKVNEPAFVRNVAEYHAQRRKERGAELEYIARVTSANASKLFSI